MRKRIKVTHREQPVVTLFYVGLLAGWAEPDTDDDAEDAPLTVRIDGTDVLTDLAKHLAPLGDPIKAEFVVNGTLHETQALKWQHASYDDSACGDPECCGSGYSPWGFWLNGYYGDQDLVSILRDLHGEDVSLTARLTGYVEPLITATLAHHWSPLGADGERQHFIPGDDVTLPLTQMKVLATSKLIRPHADQVRRLVAKPPHKRKRTTR